MKFIDEVTLAIEAGHGGPGCVSFRRERFIPRGGPDGGDGGKGGDVRLIATSRKRTLYHFQFKRQFKAPDGKSGQGKQKTGKSGAALVIEVPIGTIVIDAGTGEPLADLVSDGQVWTAAKGGRGGRGNRHFTTSTHRTPRFSQPGEPGEALTLKLELKLLADIGIIGLPNAGKSTLIRSVSSANPKIGNYPFTTLAPNLGVMKVSNREPVILADIPGLIEGAHSGAGLGIRFLRHIERTRVLIHLIDAGAVDPEAPGAGFEAVNRELALYSSDLTQKKQLVVLNKMDLSSALSGAEFFMEKMPQQPVIRVSALTGEGINEMIDAVVRLLDEKEAEDRNEIGEKSGKQV